MKTITRAKYLDRIIELNGTPDIKIITGIRRSGKSKLMQAYIAYLKSNFENINIIFIDFMDLAYEEKDVEESVDKIIANRMSKAYSEWKSNQDTQSFNENIEKEYQKLLETLSPEQEKVLTKYCDEIFASGAETEEFFYRLGIKDGLRLKSTVKSVLEMMS